MEQFDAVLRDHGLRATPQRTVVMEALMALSHPDAEGIFDFAKSRYSSMSLATVYNVLEKLRQAGLVSMLDSHGRHYFDARMDHHDHVRCRQCGRLDDVNRDPATHLVKPSVAPWIIDDPSLVWEGLCLACQGGQRSG